MPIWRFKLNVEEIWGKNGEYIGNPAGFPVDTYHERLHVKDGFVECTHPLSREYLLKRGYVEIDRRGLEWEAAILELLKRAPLTMGAIAKAIRQKPPLVEEIVERLAAEGALTSQEIKEYRAL